MTPKNLPPMRGVCVSGRVWKSVAPKTQNAKGTQRMAKSSWAARQNDRKQTLVTKELQRELKAQKQEAIDREKERQRESRLRKEENERRGQVVQAVSAAKYKRMTRKQARQLVRV